MFLISCNFDILSTLEVGTVNGILV